jgi:hypothetical protein
LIRYHQLFGDCAARDSNHITAGTAFLASLHCDSLRASAEQRKRIAQLIKQLQPKASNRAIAKTLGVSHQSVGRDVGGPSGPRDSAGATDKNRDGKSGGPSGPPREFSGERAASSGALRELSFLKNNYGALADSVVLRFRNGLFLPEGGGPTLERLAREQKADETFLDVLAKLIKQNRPVSPSAHASNYGPKVIAGHPEGKAYSQRDYQSALERLLAADRIHIASFGPPSKPLRHLAPGPAS